MKFFVVLLLSLMSTEVLAAVDAHGWYPGIGDPTIFGWFTVVCYCAAAFLSYREHQYLKRKHLLGEPKFWLGLAIILLLLGVNKQLDLQTMFTYFFREMSIQQGWYQERRQYQMMFIIGLAIGMIGLVYALRVFLARSWQLYKITWAGIILLCFFVLVRAASFHHFDRFIGERLLGLKLNVVMELGALMTIIYGIYAHRKAPKVKLNPDASPTVTVNDLSNQIACPRCDCRPSSSLVHGRTFKCKRCGFIYTIYEAQR